MLRSTRCALSLLTAFLCVGSATAQPKVDEFFSRDAVKGQRVNPSTVGGGRADAAPAPAAAAPTVVPTSSVGDFFGGGIDSAGFKSPAEMTAPPEPKATEVPGALATVSARSVYGTPGAPIFFVNAIINGMDREHMYRQLMELSHVVLKQKVPLGAVYLIGSNWELTEQEMQELRAKVGFYPGVWWSTVPSGYRITRSPTWVLQTREGQILLEGIEGLRDYINKNGEFVDIQQTTPLRKITGADGGAGPKTMGVE